MKVGIALSHFQISSYIPKEDSWNYGKLLPKPNRGIENLLGENKEKLYRVLTLDDTLKYVRFSPMLSYIVQNGKINKEKLKEYIEFFEYLYNRSVESLLVPIHFTYPVSWGKIHSEEFPKNAIKTFEEIKEMFDRAKMIETINELLHWLFFIEPSYFLGSPLYALKYIAKIKKALENIKEIHLYFWDEFHKEKIIINNVFIYRAGDVFSPLNYLLNKISESVEKLPSHIIGLHYYGTLKLFSTKPSVYRNPLFSLIHLDVNDLRKYIEDYRKKYGKEIIITEIGMSAKNKKDEYIRYSYIDRVLKLALELGLSRVYIWSSMKNFEWGLGYGEDFGFCYDLDFNKKEMCDKYIELFKKYN
ncbi:beta-glucosidase (EC 3.2.1.21) [Nanoarchaeota archaeon]